MDKQRGHGVFEKSISALRKLNSMGYGKQDSSLVLDLVYNPVGFAIGSTAKYGYHVLLYECCCVHADWSSPSPISSNA